MKVGLVGVGIMGSAIAGNLLKQGATVVGYDVDERRMAGLAAAGGVPARSASEVASQVEIVLTSLPSAAALAMTVEGILANQRSGLVVAELSTLPMEVKLDARDRLAAAGIALLDCPLSGTGAQAATGDLAVYASGERTAFDRAEPVFAKFSRVAHYLGEFGNGSKMKFVANLLVAIHNVASAEAMVLGMKAGLGPEEIARVIASGAGTSKVFELRAPLMVQGNYAPTMKIDIWQKDMAVIADYAASLGVTTPLFTASIPVYNAAQTQGHGGEDTAAVCSVLERMAGLKR
ncbi:MAG TPA: NAD(P)-dependent oxidoreductase [Stellaceae bacterium]|jgi:3-hydroxyisobutyrate dehydrogenase-like beta-hydroxyacid dehydrogenase|nr:NAD(P)-dependent oxidoreductase [Stellaceae bacterium]